MIDPVPLNIGEDRAKNGQFLPGAPGRPKGATNKISSKARESIVNFIERNVDAIQESFDILEPKEKLEFISSILSYAVPRLSSAQVDNTHTGELKVLTIAKPGDYQYPVHSGGDESSHADPESL